jgi:hypothetical protein
VLAEDGDRELLALVCYHCVHCLDKDSSIAEDLLTCLSRSAQAAKVLQTGGTPLAGVVFQPCAGRVPGFPKISCDSKCRTRGNLCAV